MFVYLDAELSKLISDKLYSVVFQWRTRNSGLNFNLKLRND